MYRMKQLATASPLLFGVVVTLAAILLIILSSLLANRWPPESEAWYFAATIGRVVSIAILLGVLFRLGWLHLAGITQPGRWQTWLITLPLLVYGLLASTYAVVGSLDFRFTDQALSIPAALLLMIHALFEEVVFRGLVMVALIAAWGETTRGLTRGVLLSSLIFAGMHLVNVLGGNPLPIVLLQGVGAFFLGILFCALLLSGRSIYPVVFLHGLLNISSFLLLAANPSATTNPAVWLLQSALTLPLAIFGLYILRGIRPRPVVLGVT